MAGFMIVILGFWALYEALQHYNAEKYSRKKNYGQDTNFFSFMLLNHPFALIFGVLVLILLVALALN